MFRKVLQKGLPSHQVWHTVNITKFAPFGHTKTDKNDKPIWPLDENTCRTQSVGWLVEGLVGRKKTRTWKDLEVVKPQLLRNKYRLYIYIDVFNMNLWTIRNTFGAQTTRNRSRRIALELWIGLVFKLNWQLQIEMEGLLLQLRARVEPSKLSQ